jgi:Transposase domain (DUF772)
VDEALAALSPEFEQLYAKFGWPTVDSPREIASRLVVAGLLLGAFGEAVGGAARLQSVVPLVCGLSLDDEVWDETVFTKNRERLIESDIARKFMAKVLDQGPVKALLSDDHFSVDGTLIEAWASMKSFRPRGRQRRAAGCWTKW